MHRRRRWNIEIFVRKYMRSKTKKIEQKTHHKEHDACAVFVRWSRIFEVNAGGMLNRCVYSWCCVCVYVSYILTKKSALLCVFAFFSPMQRRFPRDTKRDITSCVFNERKRLLCSRLFPFNIYIFSFLVLFYKVYLCVSNSDWGLGLKWDFWFFCVRYKFTIQECFFFCARKWSN